MSDADKLLETLYDELRQLARRRLRARPGQTLQPTELVHAAYLRLRDQEWESRTAFLRAGARSIRLVLVDHIREKMAQKRGGDQQRVDISVTLPGREAPVSADELLALSDSLERMNVDHPQHVEVVMLRYFGGLTIKEAAEALDIAEATVERRWRFARAWLKNDMSKR